MSTDERLKSLLLMNSLLQIWQEHLEQGQDVSALDICQQQNCPELADELNTRIGELQQTNALRALRSGIGAKATVAYENLQHDPNDPNNLRLANQRPPGVEKLPTDIAGYEILGLLGRGGMGVVYKARQISLNRMVALKMVRGWQGAQSELTTRFLREAETIARLRHANIIQIHDFGHHQGEPYFSLELLEGGTLAERTTGGPQPPKEAAALIETLSRAVQTAHEHGVIHRDLKPANVLLTADGTPKITDFGLAMQRDSQVTATGDVLGSPCYMSPEQACGRNDVGPAADIYALGGILYELLTGRPPFRGASVYDTIQLVMNAEPVLPARLTPGVPRDLETICLKCLRKEPQRRYANAAELAEDCRRFLANEPILARSIGIPERAWRWSRRHPASAALLLVSMLALVALLGIGFWFSASIGVERGEKIAAEALAAAERAERDAADIRVETAHRLAASQRYFGLVTHARERIASRKPGWTWAGLEDLTAAAKIPDASDNLVDLRSAAATCLGGIDVRLASVIGKGLTVHSVAWHPDGRRIALGERLALSTLSGRVSLVHRDRPDVPVHLSFAPGLVVNAGFQLAPDFASSVAFSPDGRWLVAGTRSGWLHRWDLTTKTTAAQSWAGHAEVIEELIFSADNRSLYSRDDKTVKRWPVGVWKEPAVHAVEGASIAIHPTEGWLFSAGGKYEYLQAESLRPTRPPASFGGDSSGYWCWLPDGRTLVRSLNDELLLYDAQSNRHASTLTSSGGQFADKWGLSTPISNPDGTLLLSRSRAHSNVKLWELASGRLLTNLAIGGGDCRLAFAPDGRSFAVTGDKETRLYTLHGNQEQTVTAIHAEPLTSFVLHPDGGSLASLRSMGMTWELTLRPLESTHASRPILHRTLTSKGRSSEDVHPLAIAPQGNWLACGLPHANLFSAWNLASKAETRLPHSGEHCATVGFSKDGRLWRIADRAVHAWDPATSKQTAIWQNVLASQLTGRPGLNALAVGDRWLAVAGQDGAVRVFPTGTGTLQQHAMRQLSQEQLESVAIREEASLIAAGSAVGRVVLASLPDVTRLAELQISEDRIRTLALGPKGLLAAGSEDGAVRLLHWNGAKLVELFTLRHDRPVLRLELRADGVTLAVLLQGERGVRLWHLDRLRTRFDQIGLGLGLECVQATPLPPSIPLRPPVPRTHQPKGPNGLKVELFSDKDLDRIAEVRHDLPIHWNRGKGFVPPRLPRQPENGLTARWSGWLKVAKPGQHLLRLRGHGRCRLWLDGQLHYDRWWTGEISFDEEIPVEFTGKAQSLTVEYSGFDPQAAIRLTWARPGVFQEQPLPREMLFHDRETATRVIPLGAEVRAFQGHTDSISP